MKIAVVCASGIGDALILHIVSHQLRENGHEVVTFSNHLAGFGDWLRGFEFALQPDPQRVEEIFSQFDAVFLQHDNSEKAKKIHALKMPVFTFYGSHAESKHGPLRKGFDFVCDQKKTMVENTEAALGELFGIKSMSRDNGLRPPEGLIYRRNKLRVAIHPTSNEAKKNWPREKFLKVAKWLRRRGYEPAFLVPRAEREMWEGPDLPTLESLASFIYESGFFLGNDSGPGHLASALKIPHLIIGQDDRQMRFWRPGWFPQGEIALPPSWAPKKYWKNFVTSIKVIKTLKNKVLNK